jgi:hypothetical protein
MSISRASAFIAPAVAAAAGIALLAGGSGQPGATPPEVATRSAVAGPRLIPLPDADSFRRQVTNRYFPLRPGARWVYRGSGAEAGERVVVRVLHRTKTILGIRATVVSDIVTEDGRLVEKTFDWFAQDDRGRVWYLGESTKSFEDGVVSTEGSWRAGVNGARAGVVMFRHHPVNRLYWQEYLAGEAEDQGAVLNRNARAAVPAGKYRQVVLTKDVTPLEPQVMELKFYAPGVGVVLEVGTSPQRSQMALVRFHKPPRR